MAGWLTNTQIKKVNEYSVLFVCITLRFLVLDSMQKFAFYLGLHSHETRYEENAKI